ncbi:MAG TPA: hypothetical protein DD727_05935 [Clostridiales bacterium]|nr:hypothetical protein [Clostridiales bacterium]
MKLRTVDGGSLSQMTLGTAQLGLEYGIANQGGKPTRKKAVEILDTAVGGGVVSFDTASAYGDSEEILGAYFTARVPAGQYPFITTKFMVEASEDTSRQGIERQIRSAAEASLRKLGLQKIPVFMLHRVEDMTRYGSAVSDTLIKLKGENLIGRAGVSVYTVTEVEEMLRHGVYQTVQLPMNLFDLRMLRSGILDRLQEAGCLVFVRSVFLQGLFFLDPATLPPQLDFTAILLKQLNRLAQDAGLSIARLAVAYIRDLPGVTSLVLGAETPRQVEENIRIMNQSGLNRQTTEYIEAFSEKVPIDKIMRALLNRK